jgi:hypothetical protein
VEASQNIQLMIADRITDEILTRPEFVHRHASELTQTLATSRKVGERRCAIDDAIERFISQLQIMLSKKIV